jgi:hypothetical protein
MANSGYIVSDFLISFSQSYHIISICKELHQRCEGISGCVECTTSKETREARNGFELPVSGMPFFIFYCVVIGGEPEYYRQPQKMKNVHPTIITLQNNGS